MAWLDETVFGEHLDQDNVFRWDVVELNLPVMSQYSPAKPWVYKKRSSDGRIAADVLTYIDDARPTGPSEEECWQAARKYASTCNHYGVQDAPRKRRPPSMTAGAWAGTVIHTHMGQVCVKVTQERWEKTRKMVRDIWQEYSDRQTEFPVEVLGEDSAGGLNHQQLERHRCFLVYVAQAYPSLVPYLKGINLTLDSWRSGRNEDGWKRTRADMEHLRRNGCPEETMKALSDEAPRLVMPVPRLEQDLKSLLTLTDPLVPPERAVRSKHLLQVCYGFGDASGEGFGSIILLDGTVEWESGSWKEFYKTESSNRRELENLVQHLESFAKSHRGAAIEVFMFTDNYVTYNELHLC
jgi:hypothetical protein